MKKSQIAVISAAGFILLIVVIVMGLGRFAVGKAFDSGSDNSTGRRSIGAADLSEQFDLDGFDTVVVEGAWKVRINSSEEFSTEIRYPSEMKNRVLVRVRGDQLVLGTQNWQGRSNGELIAEIDMPSLAEIRIEGAADTEFSGFNEETLNIVIDGAAHVQGYESVVNMVTVSLNGIGQVDLDDVKSVDARVDLQGAGEIRLNMDGGVLDGSLEGMGNIVYSGTVSEERVKIDGLGRIRSE